MKNHTKKLIAPVIITALLVVYLGVILVQGVSSTGLLSNKAAVIIVLVTLIGVSLYVLYERIKEVRSGEEDDLSKIGRASCRETV